MSSLMETPDPRITGRPDRRSCSSTATGSIRMAVPSATISTSPSLSPTSSRNAFGITTRPALSMVERISGAYERPAARTRAAPQWVVVDVVLEEVVVGGLVVEVVDGLVGATGVAFGATVGASVGPGVVALPCSPCPWPSWPLALPLP